MAINSPGRLNTDIASRDYSNSERDAQAKALANSIQHGVTDRDDTLAKFLLGQKATKEDLEAIQNIKGVDKDGKPTVGPQPGQNIKVGNVDINHSAEGKLAFEALQAAKKEDRAKESRITAQSDKLQKIYGGQSKEVEDALHQVESGLAGLNLGNKDGDKTAVAALTRLADGKGQRMTQAQLQSMTPKDAQGDLTSMGNYWSAKAASGLSDADRAAFKALFAAHQNRLGSELGDISSEVKQQAPTMAPDLLRSGQFESYTSGIGSKARSTLDRLSKMGAEQVKTADTPNRGVLPKAASGVFGGLKSLLFGSSDSPQGQAPAAAPQGPQQSSQAAPPQGMGQLLKPQAPPQGAPAGKPKQVIQNGHTYTLDEASGTYQ